MPSRDTTMIIIEPLAYQSIRPLRSLCIVALKELILSYQRALPTNDKSTLQDAMYVLSPFDSLPSQCVQELIDLLAEKKQLNLDLISILIHTHLTSLDFTSIKEHSKHLFKPKLLHIITVRCRELLHLTLGMSSKQLVGKLEVHELISSNTYLRTLILSNFRPVNELMSSISSMLYLTTLDLSNSNLSDEAINILTSGLNPLPELRSLNISNTEVTSQGLNLILSRLTFLHHLDLSQLSLIVPIVNLGNHSLQSLLLISTEILPGNLYILLGALSQLQNLELVPCHNAFIQDDWLWEVLPLLTGITQLSLYRASFHLSNLSFAKHLVELSLPSTETSLSAPLFCSLFPSLQLLNLDECTIADGVLSPGLEQSCPGLRKLSLVRATFTLTQHTLQEGDELVAFLSSFGKLRELDLGYTEIYSNNLLDLLRRTSEFQLTRLSLKSCCRLNGTIIEFLDWIAHTCRHLCHIDLKYCLNIIQRDVIGLRDALKHSSPPVPHGLSVEWS